MAKDDLEDQIRKVAALGEPTRLAIYRYIAEAGREVGRDEAAQELGISRALAAFHLDRLVEEGLLETTFRRLSGAAGPGAGRPAKLYRRSRARIEVTLPPTQYESAARLLVRAMAKSGSAATARALSVLAREYGGEIGAEARRRAGARAGKAALLEHTMAVLTEHGYEPVQGPEGEILMRNCPFDAIARENRELVCGMNLALMEGLVEGLRLQGIAARLDPQPGYCCVAIGRKARRLQP